MAGFVTVERWMQVKQLIAMLRELPESSFVEFNPVTHSLMIFRGDDAHPTHPGLLKWINMRSEELTA